VIKVKTCSVTLFLVSCILLLASAAHAGDPLVSVGLGVEFATGDYGTGVTTDSVAVPLSIDIYPTTRLELKLAVPFLYQSNSNTVAAGGVRFRRNGYGGYGGYGYGSLISGNGMNGNGPGGSAANLLYTLSAYDESRSESGLGNISLKSGYIVLEEGEYLPQLKPILYVEFPTADKDKGLGTGEFVTGLGLAVDKWLGNWQAYLEGIYNFQGSSDLYALKDFFSYEAGVGYQVTDRMMSNLSLLGSTKPADGASDLLETRVKLAYRLTARSRFEGYLAAGLTTGSPDFGAGVSAFYSF
jgi:hypothetical protein